jgi:hypothetical protein
MLQQFIFVKPLPKSNKSYFGKGLININDAKATSSGW